MSNGKKDKSKQQKPASKTVKTVKVPKPEEKTADQEAQPVNLCDDCAYEFGECEGKPKFASAQDETLTGAAADRVIECAAFRNVAEMPTAQEAAAQGPAAAEGEARVCDIEHLGNYPDCFRDCPKDECDGVPAAAHDGDDKDEPTAFDLALSRLDEFGQAQLNARADEIREEADRRFGPDAEPTTEEMAGTLVLIVKDIIQEETEPEYIPAPGPVRPDPKRFQAEEDFGTCPSCGRPLKRTAFNRYQDALRCTNGRCRAYRTVVKTISTGVK